MPNKTLRDELKTIQILMVLIGSSLWLVMTMFFLYIFTVTPGLDFFSLAISFFSGILFYKFLKISVY